MIPARRKGIKTHSLVDPVTPFFSSLRRGRRRPGYSRELRWCRERQLLSRRGATWAKSFPKLLDHLVGERECDVAADVVVHAGSVAPARRDGKPPLNGRWIVGILYSDSAVFTKKSRKPLQLDFRGGGRCSETRRKARDSHVGTEIAWMHEHVRLAL